MPTYKNNTSSSITPVGGATYAAGEQRDEREYFKDPNGLTLVSHIPVGANGKELFDGSVIGGSGTISGLYLYDLVRVYNGSDAVIEIQANNDSTNVHKVPAAAIFEIENTDPRSWYSVEISGTGSGNVQVMGL